MRCGANQSQLLGWTLPSRARRCGFCSHLVVFLGGGVAAEALEAGAELGDVGPVEALVLPVVVEGHGVAQIVRPHRRLAAVDQHLADVVPVRKEQRRRHTCVVELVFFG